VTNKTLLYAERDLADLDHKGGFYAKHVSAMTGEDLHSKSAIAAELAHRDYMIEQLLARVHEQQKVINEFYS